MNEVWNIALRSLEIAHKKHPITLISFVLMSNHYHMLLRTPHENLDKFMYEFNKNFSLLVRYRAYRENRIFGNRYKWCLINSQKYFYNCYKYVYQNPMRARITLRCEDYPYSTLYYITRHKRFVIPVHDLFGFKDEFNLIMLNQMQSENEIFSVRNALRKPELTMLKDPVRRVYL